jgi:hypothetical protein
VPGWDSQIITFLVDMQYGIDNSELVQAHLGSFLLISPHAHVINAADVPDIAVIIVSSI